MILEGPAWKIYWWLEERIAPGVQYAQVDVEEQLFSIVRAGDVWLDVGCGHTLLPEWRAAQEHELLQRPETIVGLDPEFAALREHRGISLRACGDAERLPFVDGIFDLVTANMVVEHLPEPETQFLEIARVLKPGGQFLFHTPNAQGYPTVMARLVPDRLRGLAARMLETRPAEDRFSTYYRANTPASIEALSRKTGFVVEQMQLVRSTAVFWRFAPLAAIELVLLRVLASSRFAWLRPNLIAVLRKA